MTHNITGNEAHLPSAHVRIRTGRRRRLPAGVKRFFAGAIGVGVVASIADTLIGQPVCLTLIVVAFVAWRFWPTGR